MALLVFLAAAAGAGVVAADLTPRPSPQLKSVLGEESQTPSLLKHLPMRIRNMRLETALFYKEMPPAGMRTLEPQPPKFPHQLLPGNILRHSSPELAGLFSAEIPESDLRHEV